jgi:hypothetical protein
MESGCDDKISFSGSFFVDLCSIGLPQFRFSPLWFNQFSILSLARSLAPRPDFNSIYEEISAKSSWGKQQEIAFPSSSEDEQNVSE